MLYLLFNSRVFQVFILDCLGVFRLKMFLLLLFYYFYKILNNQFKRGKM